MIVEAGGPFTLAATKHCDREAIRHGSDARTYVQLREAANRVGSAFAGSGLTQGDPSRICLRWLRPNARRSRWRPLTQSR